MGPRTQLCMAVMTAAALSCAAQGQDFWHAENIQILRGEDYELGSTERTIFTVEHASRWSGGDFFLFTDFFVQRRWQHRRIRRNHAAFLV